MQIRQLGFSSYGSQTIFSTVVVDSSVEFFQESLCIDALSRHLDRELFEMLSSLSR